MNAGFRMERNRSLFDDLEKGGEEAVNGEAFESGPGLGQNRGKGEEKDEERDDEIRGEPVTAGPRTGRNDLCPCGSGKKFKKCCFQADG